MNKTHWKKFTNPDYLGAYSLDENETRVLTIKEVKQELIAGINGKKEECILCYWQENEKPMILNATNCKTIAKLYNTPYIEDWTGRKIAIKAEMVNAFGEMISALRIQSFIPNQTKVSTICADCGNKIQELNGNTPQQIASYTYKKYGKSLCSDCAKKEAEKVLENNIVMRTQHDLDEIFE